MRRRAVAEAERTRAPAPPRPDPAWPDQHAPQTQPQPAQQQPQQTLQQQQQQPAVASAPQPAWRAALAAAQRLVSSGPLADARLRGLLALNLMTLLMGTNWVVIKDSNAAFDPVVFTSLRFTLAAAAFMPFLTKGLASQQVRAAGLEIGAWTAAGYIAQSAALALTPASRASLLSTFTVLAVPCLAGLSGQRIKPLVWGCGGLALAGTLLLEQGGGEPANWGDALSILSALFFAFQLFRTEQRSRELPAGSNLQLMAVVLATVAACSCAAAGAVHARDAAGAAQALWATLSAGLAALGPGDSPAGAAQPLLEVLYTAFASTDLVLLIELLALQDVSSTEAALIYSLEPVSGAAMAYAFLGERWGKLGWLGAALILAASITTQLGGAMQDGSSSSSGGSGSSSSGGASSEPAGEAASDAARS